MIPHATTRPDLAAPAARISPLRSAHPLNRRLYYRLAAAAAAPLPRGARLRIARVLGRALGRHLGDARAGVRANLGRVLAGAGPAVVEAAVTETFANFAACFVDLLVLNRRDSAGLGAHVASVEGEAHLAAAFGARRGAVLLTAHLGNWELGGRLLARHAARVTHVALSPEADPTLEGYLRLDGPRFRFVTLDRATSPIGLLAALRRDELVAMQGDRPTGGRGDRLVPFFGAPAPFPIGPFVLARAAAAPVLAAFCAARPDGRYEIVVEPPIWVEPGEEAAGLTWMVGALERAVRAHPTQWFNFFDVWSGPRGGG